MAIKKSLADLVMDNITTETAKTLLIELAQMPSPLTTLMEAEPQLRSFIDKAVEPRLRQAGFTDIRRDSMGNLLAQRGNDQSGRSLMLVTNAMTQPPSTMSNPYSGEVRDGKDFDLPGEVVLGKGVSEQKAPLAAILLALKAISDSQVLIEGRLMFVCCVSGETGRHDAIHTLLTETGARAQLAILNGTRNRISLGNRGRVDITLTVHGVPGHSSRPSSACNAITGAVEVIQKITEALSLPAPHPELGPATVAINRICSLPQSTHTIQDRCEISVDRRLLPGEDPDAAVSQITSLVKSVEQIPDPASGKSWTIDVTKGPFMYPSLVSSASSVVLALSEASVSAIGEAPTLYYQTNAFDQGYLNHVGIESCCYGPGEDRYAHTDLDMASVDRTRDASKVYAALIMQQLSKSGGVQQNVPAA